MNQHRARRQEAKRRRRRERVARRTPEQLAAREEASGRRSERGHAALDALIARAESR